MHMLLFLPVESDYSAYTMTALLSDKVLRFFFDSIIANNSVEHGCAICK